MRNEKTSKKVRSLAAKGIKKPETLTDDEVQTISASALTQSPDKNGRELSPALQIFQYCEQNEVGTEEVFNALTQTERETALSIAKRVLALGGDVERATLAALDGDYAGAGLIYERVAQHERTRLEEIGRTLAGL